MNDNMQIWQRTGAIGLLPHDARLRLQKAAAVENPKARISAIDAASAWVRSTYPEYFSDTGINNQGDK